REREATRGNAGEREGERNANADYSDRARLSPTARVRVVSPRSRSASHLVIRLGCIATTWSPCHEYRPRRRSAAPAGALAAPAPRRRCHTPKLPGLMQQPAKHGPSLARQAPPVV